MESIEQARKKFLANEIVLIVILLSLTVLILKPDYFLKIGGVSTALMPKARCLLKMVCILGRSLGFLMFLLALKDEIILEIRQIGLKKE